MYPSEYFGGHLNSNLLFKSHIRIKCKAVMINIIRIQNMKKYLTKDTCHTLVLCLAISHIDYSNLLLIGLAKKSINLMEHVQHTEAKVILNRHTKDHATRSLKELCWLPI